LATPARLATSSIRVAVNPREMNSSSAASMMASRRSAVRSARFDGGFGDVAFAPKADFGALTEAAFSPCRPMAGFSSRRPLADFDGAPPEVPDPVRVFDMDYI
jgi:hypothetical protein